MAGCDYDHTTSCMIYAQEISGDWDAVYAVHGSPISQVYCDINRMSDVSVVDNLKYCVRPMLSLNLCMYPFR